MNDISKESNINKTNKRYLNGYLRLTFGFAVVLDFGVAFGLASALVFGLALGFFFVLALSWFVAWFVVYFFGLASGLASGLIWLTLVNLFDLIDLVEPDYKIDVAGLLSWLVSWLVVCLLAWFLACRLV